MKHHKHRLKNEEGRRVVTFLRDTALTYPDLWMDVYIAGSPSEERQFAEMFIRARCKKAATPLDADLVVFTGGPDVDPTLYQERPHSSTRVDISRDKKDLELYQLCKAEGIPMLGICRGAQFLHVMQGGKLYQDVDQHHGEHPIWDLKNKKLVLGVSSVHHQLVRPHEGMEIIATCAGRSKLRHLNDKEYETGAGKDIEAFFYPKTCVIGIQGHPEYFGYDAFTHWSLHLINQLVMENHSIEYRNRKCRIKEETV